MGRSQGCAGIQTEMMSVLQERILHQDTITQFEIMKRKNRENPVDSLKFNLGSYKITMACKDVRKRRR